MSADRVQRRAEILDLIAEAGLALALDLKDAALAAETVEAKAAAAAEFHRVTRGVRQSLALEERFERNAETAGREREADRARRAERAVAARKDQVRAAVERRIYQETEPHDARVRLEDLNDRLEAEALFDGFTDEAVEAHIERLAAGLGLTGEPRVPYAPRALRPAWLAGYPPVDWRRMLGCDDEDEDEDEDEGDPGDEADDDPADDPDDEAAFESDHRGYEADFGEPQQRPPAAAPPPDPPAEPPAEPYIPPWERLRPGERFPGGSGW